MIQNGSLRECERGRNERGHVADPEPDEHDPGEHVESNEDDVRIGWVVRISVALIGWVVRTVWL